MNNRQKNNKTQISKPGIIVVAGIAIAVTMFLIVHLSNRSPSESISVPESTPEPPLILLEPEPEPEPEPDPPEPEPERRYDHHGIWLEMPIFYHPDGANFFHIDQNCPSVEDRFLPLAGETTFEGLDQSKYRQLQPCISCQAPARPHVH